MRRLRRAGLHALHGGPAPGPGGQRAEAGAPPGVVQMATLWGPLVAWKIQHL